MTFINVGDLVRLKHYYPQYYITQHDIVRTNIVGTITNIDIMMVLKVTHGLNALIITSSLKIGWLPIGTIEKI